MIHPEIRLAYVNSMAWLQEYSEKRDKFVEEFIAGKEVTKELIYDLISQDEFNEMSEKIRQHKSIVEHWKDIVEP